MDPIDRQPPQVPHAPPPQTGVVLVVDDEPAMRKLLVRHLEGRGHHLLTAPDAAAARDLLARHSVDVMLCDLMMPGESGESLIQFVSRDHPEVGVVVITGVVEPALAQQVLDVGVLGYLVKPIDRNQVIITVANALRLTELERRERARRQALERDVEEQKRALDHLQEASREDRQRLQGQEEALRDATGTVRVLLNQRGADRTEFESEVLENVRRTIEPYVHKLKGSHLSPTQEGWVEALAANLERIVSPFIKSLAAPYLNLTPAELQVADLIRQGRTTKQIADILSLSPNTVMTHRFHLRDKLGLKNSPTSLRSYLESLAHPRS